MLKPIIGTQLALTYLPILLLGVLTLVALWLGSAKQKGKRGEMRVFNILTQGLPDGYIILNDIYLPSVGDTTAQIDHIVVSQYGIFVIETKNYSGLIFTDARGAEWAQSLHGPKRPFEDNPIRQNDSHICAIAECLGISKNYLHGVVAFTEKCTFKTPRPDCVVYTAGLVDYIRSFNRVQIDPAQVPAIAKAIAECSGSVSKERKANHVANLKKSHSATRTGVTPVCPYCGGRMVLRTRKKDGAKFYGCVSYPACHGIVNITSLGNPWEQNIWGQTLAPPARG